MSSDDDNIPQLPADTLAILEQFLNEQEQQHKLELEGNATIDENWQDDATKEIKLNIFEFDQRFGNRYPEEYIFYDYNKPQNIEENLKGIFDVIIADPPFLSDECLVKTAQTIRLLGKKNVKIILCTGAIMEEVASRLLGVKRISFTPQHANNLANDFACFTNYEPEYLL